MTLARLKNRGNDVTKGLVSRAAQFTGWTQLLPIFETWEVGIGADRSPSKLARMNFQEPQAESARPI